MSVSNAELLVLIERIKAAGAKVTTTLDAEAIGEGRELIATVQVEGVKGIGPHPMGPIGAAEAIREALFRIASYEHKLDAKVERLEDRADRLMKEGTAKVNAGSEAMSLIPFGQPILIGHHSETRDRNYRRKNINKISAGYALQKEAGEVAARAASVGTGGISSDNPVAVAELMQKLEKLEAVQAKMIAANKLVRKGKVEELATLMGSQLLAQKLMEPDYCGRKGFASYQLTNNGANIRRIQERIEHLKREAGRETKETLHNSGVKVVENTEENRVQLFFPGKPSEAIRGILKGRGFRWSPSEGAWQRQLNNAGIWAAKEVLKQLIEMEVST